MNSLTKLASLSVFLALPGCSWFQSHPAVVSDLQTTEACVVAELQKDAAAGDTAITIGIDIGVTCGGDAVKVLEDALAKTQASAKNRAGVLVAARK